MRVGQQPVGCSTVNTVESKQSEDSGLRALRSSITLFSVPDRSPDSRFSKGAKRASIYWSLMVEKRNKDGREYETYPVAGKLRQKMSFSKAGYAAGLDGLLTKEGVDDELVKSITPYIEKLNEKAAKKEERGKWNVFGRAYDALGRSFVRRILLPSLCSNVKWAGAADRENPRFKVPAGCAKLEFSFEVNRRHRAGEAAAAGPRFSLTELKETTADRGEGSRTTSWTPEEGFQSTKLPVGHGDSPQSSGTEMSHAEPTEMNQEELRDAEPTQMNQQELRDAGPTEMNQEELRDAANDYIERFRQTGDTDMAAKALHCIQAIADDEQAVEMQKSLKQAMTEKELRDSANYYIERFSLTRSPKMMKKALHCIQAVENDAQAQEMRRSLMKAIEPMERA